MKYNGMELKEADGKDYPPSAPKSMLVWDKNHIICHVREVIGFINGRWAAVDGAKGAGTCDWDYAAEIPKQKTLAELAREIRNKNKLFPYIIHPEDVSLTREERDCCIGVGEESILLHGPAMDCAPCTLIIHPACCDIVKAMAKRLAESNAAHPTVIFFGE